MGLDHRGEGGSSCQWLPPSALRPTSLAPPPAVPAGPDRWSVFPGLVAWQPLDSENSACAPLDLCCPSLPFPVSPHSWLASPRLFQFVQTPAEGTWSQETPVFAGVLPHVIMGSPSLGLSFL